MHIHAYAYACTYIYTCTRAYTEYTPGVLSTNKESVLLVVQQSRRFEIVAVKAGGSGGGGTRARKHAYAYTRA